jgi:hypothetical protein
LPQPVGRQDKFGIRWDTLGLATTSSTASDALANEYTWVIAGDFIGDDQEELLVGGAANRLTILDIQGKPLSSLPLRNQRPICAWDCNGDGHPEIISVAASTSGSGAQGLEAFDINGKVIDNLPYLPLNSPKWGPYPLVGDADGDGKAELWLTQGAPYRGGLVALGANQRIVVDERQAGSFRHPVVCDLDGKGKYGLAAVTDSNGKVEFVSVNGRRKLGYLGTDLGLTGCRDVDGDGRRDILCGETGYINQAAGGFVPYPVTGDGFVPPQGAADSYLLLDIDGYGGPEQIYFGPDMATPRAGSTEHLARLRITDQETRRVVHDETFTYDTGLGMTLAQARGTDFLIVAAGSRLLAYPDRLR